MNYWELKEAQADVQFAREELRRAVAHRNVLIREAITHDGVDVGGVAKALKVTRRTVQYAVTGSEPKAKK